MLSWSTDSLIADARSQGEIRQGVTTQIFGEGWSMGPLSDAMKRQMVADQGDIKFAVEWTTLAEYLRHLERRGVSQNVASFVGATTVRIHVLGEKDVKPSPAQLEEMKELVRREMEAGALGVGTSLIYPPAFYASTEELIELCKVAARYRGKYISHMRSEGARLVEAVEELSASAARPASRGDLPPQAAGPTTGRRWRASCDVERRAAAGPSITATCTPTGRRHGADGRAAPWSQDGGSELVKRIRCGDARRILEEMRTPTESGEPLPAAGSAERVLLAGFKTRRLSR